MLDEQIIMCKKLSQRFIAKHPNKREDILSAAFEGLVVGLDIAEKKGLVGKQAEAYVVSKIRFTMQEQIASDCLVRIPARSRLRHDIPFPTVSDIKM